MVNRSGSQAIKAKVVIDATRRASLAQSGRSQVPNVCAGRAGFPLGGGGRGVAVGAWPRRSEAGCRLPESRQRQESRVLSGLPIHGQVLNARRQLHVVCRAEQAFRNLVSGAGMQDCSEYATYFPADTMRIGKPPNAVRCGAFRPQGVARIYVLSEYADVHGSMRPLAFLAAGELVGQAAATEAGQLTRPADVRLAASVGNGGGDGNCRRAAQRDDPASGMQVWLESGRACCLCGAITMSW